MYKFYKGDLPQDSTVDSFLRRNTDIDSRIEDMQYDYPSILELAHNLDNEKLKVAAQDAYDQFGWWGFLIGNFGEHYKDLPERSPRLGGLSITHNPDYWQSDIDINCQTLGNRKHNLPPDMYAGPRGNEIFEQVNIRDLRSEFWTTVNHEGPGPAWKFLHKVGIVGDEEYNEKKEFYESFEHNPKAINQTGLNTYSDALSFNRLSPSCSSGYLGEVFKTVGNRTIVRGRLIEMKWGDIHWHRDEKFYINFRINIPLYFDPSTQIATEKLQMEMHPGNIYHFDTGEPHAVVRVNEQTHKRVNIIFGVTPWFDFDEKEQAWISNEFYGRMHPVEMFKQGYLVDWMAD